MIFLLLVSITIVGGVWSECNEEASLHIEEYRPAWAPLISPFAKWKKYRAFHLGGGNEWKNDSRLICYTFRSSNLAIDFDFITIDCLQVISRPLRSTQSSPLTNGFVDKDCSRARSMMNIVGWMLRNQRRWCQQIVDSCSRSTFQLEFLVNTLPKSIYQMLFDVKCVLLQRKIYCFSRKFY